MSWQVRHEGSPHVTAGLTAQQVLEGVAEGVWDPSDEVRGPSDTKWHQLETHPTFEEPIAEIYEPKKVEHDDSHLDMNPLIDVALVLLIFFILTTSYDALTKLMDMPSVTRKGQGVKEISGSKLNELIRVEGRVVDGKTVLKVDNQEVTVDQLRIAMSKGVAEKRTQMVIDVKDVTWDIVVKIIDAGKLAGVTKFMMRVQSD